MTADDPSVDRAGVGDADRRSPPVETASAPDGTAPDTSARREQVLAALADAPATATQLAADLGLARTTINDHLRALQVEQLIERAPELGDRRQRFWRVSSAAARRRGVEQRTITVDARVAARTARLQRWLDRQDAEERPWTRAAVSRTVPLALDPDELASLADELGEVLERHRQRAAASDRADRRAVVVQLDAYPLERAEEP